MLPYILSLIGGYLIGSFPTGFLLVKKQSDIDITATGSGNVGAFNAGFVTGSKWVGLAVGVIDGLKGLGTVILFHSVFPGFWPPALGLVAAIIGHNYPPWLRFKGGRGLATACGGMLGVGPAFIVVWCVIWAVMKWQRQTILGSNLIATFAAPVVLVLVPSTSLETLMVLPGSAFDYRILVFALCVLFVVSHRDGFQELKRKHGE